MKDVRPRTQGPEPSAARLGPRALSAGVVVSLGSKKNGIIVLFITTLFCC